MLNEYSKIVQHIYSYCFKNVHRVLFKMFNGYKNVQDIYIYTYFLIFFYFGFGYSMSIQLFTLFLNFVQYILHNVQCVFANCSTYFHKMFSTCPKILCIVNNIQIHVEHFFLNTMNSFWMHAEQNFYTWWTFFIHTEYFSKFIKFDNSSSILKNVHQFWKMFINFERKFIDMK